MGIRPLIALLTLLSVHAFAQKQAVTFTPGSPVKLDIGLNVGTGTPGTWGTGANAQTGQFTLSGTAYCNSTTGEHLFINSANSSTVSSVGTRGNVLALWASRGMASAARFLRSSDGAEVGAVGYISAPGWYADNSVFLSASMPYALADGAHPPDGTPPPNLILAQEGWFNGGVAYAGRVKLDTNWNFIIQAPDNVTPQLTVTPFGRVGIGGYATAAHYLDVFTNDISGASVHIKNSNNGTGAGAQYEAESASGNEAVLAAYGSGFSYRAYPANGAALISGGTGGLAVMSTAGGSTISFYAGGDTSANLCMQLGSGGLSINSGGIAVGGGALISKTLTTTVTWDPPSLANGASSKDSGITLTGVSPGDVVTAALTTITSSDWTVQACVTAADTVEVKITNNTGGAVDLASGTLRVNCIKF